MGSSHAQRNYLKSLEKHYSLPNDGWPRANSIDNFCILYYYIMAKIEHEFHLKMLHFSDELLNQKSTTLFGQILYNKNNT